MPIADMRDASLKLPEQLVLDSSVVLEWAAPLPYQRTDVHAETMRFMVRVQASTATMPILPLPALVECFHIFTKWAVAGLAKSRGFGGDWQGFVKANPSVLRVAAPKLEAALQDILAFGIWIPEPEHLLRTVFRPTPLYERVHEMMGGFEVMAQDAHIIATAERLQVTDLVSLDIDFTRATGFRVFTIPK